MPEVETCRYSEYNESTGKWDCIATHHEIYNPANYCKNCEYYRKARCKNDQRSTRCD